MKPMRMHPAYRYGAMTPWGSNALRTVYGREIPDEVCGEALEISVIPGLESQDDRGIPLPGLIREYGPALTGAGYEKSFPLLLKLLAAKTPLSVQVHPDDAYAAVHENKLGKTEAWVILKAEEGARLIYGLKDGVSKEELKHALENGEDLEPMLAAVPVRPGDVYYMPSGMVHAIGGGIVLYEIQQSSDVTYRLWDYNRVNEKGEKRPLHIRQSVDVIRPEEKGLHAFLPETAERDECLLLLDVPAFRLEGLLVREALSVPHDGAAFGILTALEPLTLCWEEETLSLSAGDSVLIPADCPPLTLRGKGRALLSSPGRSL